MDLKEGKSVINSFLMGQHVEQILLSQAIEAVCADPEYTAYLQNVFGNHSCWVTECDIFRSRLAEFAEFSPAQREQYMPQSAKHFAACDECRQAYWQVVGAWDSNVVDQNRTVRRLRAPIAFRVGSEGQILLDRSGPPPLRHDVVAAAAYGAEVTQPKLWELDDVEGDLVVHLAIQRHQTGGVEVRCRIEQTSGLIVDPRHVRAEVCDIQTGVVRLAGPLTNFVRNGLVVEPGASRLCLTMSSGTVTSTWEMDLEYSSDA